MSTNPDTPTIEELLARLVAQQTRIERLEDKLGRHRGRSRRRFGSRVLTVAATVMVVLGVAGGPAFASPTGPPWGTTGNTGTNPSTNYVGTADNAGLSLRTNGKEAMAIDTSQNVSLRKNATVQGSLNAVGGLQENGTFLVNKYVKLDGSNAPASSAPLPLTVAHATDAVSAPNLTGNLSGDVTGGQTSTVVSALHGTTLSSTAPTDGQVLTYSNSDQQWEPQAISSSLDTQVPASTHDVACCAGNVQLFEQSCPSGYSVTGGGFYLGADSQHVWQSGPDGTSTWAVRVTDDFGGLPGHTMNVYAVCVKFSP